jgi:hypothetical protein
MLRCVRRYRNGALGIFTEPGEILIHDASGQPLTTEFASWLLRDAPGCFERADESEPDPAPEAPSHPEMARREKAQRDESERQFHGLIEGQGLRRT